MTTTNGDPIGGDDPGGDAPRYVEATSPSPTPPRNGVWLAAAGLVAVVLVVIALVAVTRPAPDDTALPSTTTTPDGSEDDGQQAVDLGVAAPYDGKASMRLPITVTPNRDLVDGQTVTVSGTGFPPGADLGVLMCTNEAVFDGIAACDISTAVSSISMTHGTITADETGSFSVPYTVRFHFSVADPDAAAATPGTVVDPGGGVIVYGPSAPMRSIDCGAGDIDPDVWPTVIPPTAESDPGGFTCIIAAGMVNDYDKSGGAAIGAAGAQFRTFDPSETHARPTVAPPSVPDPSAPTSVVGALPTTTIGSTVPSTPPPVSIPTGPVSSTTTTRPVVPPDGPTEPPVTTTTGPP